MNIQKLFDLLRPTQFQYFEGNFFNQNIESSDESSIQIFFSTIRGGKGDSISIESCENNLFDLTIYNVKDGVQEFLEIPEQKIFEKLNQL